MNSRRGTRSIRYDERGNGLSDWDTPELSLDAFVDDLNASWTSSALEHFDLLAISQGAAVAVAFAVRYPDRVRRLVIVNGYAAGWAVHANPAEVARREAMITLSQVGWGADNPSYRQLFTNLYIPGASAKQMGWFNEMQRISASPENAVRLMRVLGNIDVRDLLGQVQTPTLIFHSRDDQAVHFSRARRLRAEFPAQLRAAREPQPHPDRNGAGLAAVRRWQSRFLQYGDADVLPAVAKSAAPSVGGGEVAPCISADGVSIAYAETGPATRW